jgi:hypothetical protein
MLRLMLLVVLVYKTMMVLEARSKSWLHPRNEQPWHLVMASRGVVALTAARQPH